MTNVSYTGGRTVTVTGKVLDPYNGEFEGTGSYTINVKKKIQSVQTVRKLCRSARRNIQRDLCSKNRIRIWWRRHYIHRHR